MFRTTIRMQVRDRLIEGIINGKFPAGQRLRELEVAEMFRTSQGTVREALRELEAMGLVHSEAHRGTWVREFGVKDIVGNYEVRTVIDGLACRLAATNRNLPLRVLKELADETLKYAVADDLERFLAADYEFHSVIVHAAENEPLFMVWRSLISSVTIVTRQALPPTDSDQVASRVFLSEQHYPIVEALSNGDPDGAEAAMKEHMASVITTVKKVYAETSFASERENGHTVNR
ncbi:MAG: GntR family transcriptional regulator [Armatimonadetes bacterium]|nr:GntR family transcriptional regulator [Armatimonadota bacterium]